MNPPSPTPLLALHEISLYNTGRVSPEKIIAAFAARMDQFQRIVADIVAEKPRSRAQHHLIVGQRGMGKTMLLARIAAELRTKPELAARFIPLVFAEEQYAVDRLSKFWLNCLDSLADARENAKDTKAVAEIDNLVRDFSNDSWRAAKNDQPFADKVYEAFVKAAHASGQRPVLLVDNLQLVFERLETAQQHSLRELLMRAGAPILIGASPSPPQESQDYGAAFYDHFKVHYLRPLEEQEMRDLLIHLATVAQRDDVRQRVLQHPARLKVLRQLTGGNPRTTLTLFFLYAEDFAPSVFGDLEGLLDRVTPLYKARIEELTPQQQVIISAIANHWDPVTAAALAATTSLPASTISAQLDRLEKHGAIERVELFGETRTGYMIAERFFNIWFLMRSASRRQRREVEFLTRFLENFYEPSDRVRIARHLMGEEHFSPDRYLWSRAVAASLTEPETAEELKRHNELMALREAETEARRRLHELIDFDSLPLATLAFDDLRKKLIALVPAKSDVLPEDFAKAVLGSRVMFINGEREKLASRSGTLSRKEIRSILQTTAKSNETDERVYTKDAASWFFQRLAKGQLRHQRDAEDWNRAFQQAAQKECIRLMVDSLPKAFGNRLTDSAIDSIRSLLEPHESQNFWSWFRWATVLRDKLGRYSEAESAYRKAIALSPKTGMLWNSLGIVLHGHLQRFAEAESAYRKAIELDPKGSRSWNNLGALLDDLKRYAEAEAAYCEAIALDATDSWPWNNLGNMFQNPSLRRYMEAEAAYREAIVRDPKDAVPWSNLGNMFLGHLQRHDEAENAYREAIARDSNYAGAWNGLGIIYGDFRDRFADAMAAYNMALKIEPAFESAIQNLIFLRRDFMGEGVAARSLMTELTSLPDRESPDTAWLHEALFAIYEKNWGLATEALASALALRLEGLALHNTDDWLRAGAVFIHLGCGAELLAFLDQQGETTARLRPWVEALRALQIGDRRALQNLAPEIRATAEIFYDGMERRLLKLPEKTRRRPVPKLKRTRVQRR